MSSCGGTCRNASARARLRCSEIETMSDKQKGVAAEQVGVCFFPTRSAGEVVDVAMLCEELGFGFLGVGDVHELWADPYLSLALAARATARINIGPWVTNPVTRHPTVTANAIATLN